MYTRTSRKVPLSVKRLMQGTRATKLAVRSSRVGTFENSRLFINLFMLFNVRTRLNHLEVHV